MNNRQLFMWVVDHKVNIKENLFTIYPNCFSITPIWILYKTSCIINSIFLSLCSEINKTITEFQYQIYDVIMARIFNKVIFQLSIKNVLNL